MFHTQVKEREREKLKMLESNDSSDEYAETNENDELFVEVDVDNRFVFVRAVPDKAPTPNKHV